MSQKAETIHRGTLVCVVLKAKNLPNKKSIGKQDPYCTLSLGTNVQKTKPDKRGGQHPTWDEQLHFEIFDDMEDQLRNADGSGSLGPSSSSTITAKSGRGKTSKSLRVCCYADDAKEPEFIGDGVVDLADTLRTGEFDEWVTIKAKDRYAGEVYLELTFYSSAAPPKKKKPSQPMVPSGTTYGGAGTFSEDFDEYEFAPRPVQKEPSHASIPPHMRPASQNTQRPGHPGRPSNSSGMSSSKSHAHLGSISTSEDVPSSLRPSSSLAQLDTYNPPYAPANIQREKSPAPVPLPGVPPPAPSPSVQLYGHRLSDAGPASVVSHQYHTNALPSSMSQQHLPSSHSVSKPRINPSESYDASVDELTRPMSSMSMIMRPTAAEQQQQVSAYHSSVQGGHPSYVVGQASVQVDQFGRPLPAVSAHSYMASSTLTPAPTPPPASHSAPPAGGEFQQQLTPSWPTLHPTNTPQHHVQHNTLIPDSFSQGRPASPGGVLRPHTAGGYHALPQPPVPQQSSYQSPYLSQPDGPPAHPSHAPPPPLNQMPSSASSTFAQPPPPSNYYPPPAQTPSHYISPLPIMQWPHLQAGPPAANSAYVSYPPPPPGPSNGGYIHPGPQQASPSNHPGQYPPPPPIHQLDYAQQQPPPPSAAPLPPPPQKSYYNAPPLRQSPPSAGVPLPAPAASHPGSAMHTLHQPQAQYQHHPY